MEISVIYFGYERAYVIVVGFEVLFSFDDFIHFNIENKVKEAIL